MAADKPLWKFPVLPLGNVWDEATTPRKVGDVGGLVQAQNHYYHRNQAWGKRPGSATCYEAQTRGPLFGMPNSGVRWYRSFPQPLTRTVIASEGALWYADDPRPGNNPSDIIQIAQFTGQSDIPVSMTSARDPWARNYNGEDELIVCGFTGPYAFGTGSIILSGAVPNNTDEVISVAVQYGALASVTTIDYTILQTDTPTTVAQNLAQLLNETSAATSGSPAPFLSQSTTSTNATGLNPNASAAIHMGALMSGTSGNTITFGAVYSGTHVGITANNTFNTSPGTFTGGGNSTSAPLKYDGAAVQGLSYQIKNAFTGCVTWHNHTWFWGDPNNPETLFASDINEPEGWTFMTQYGGYFIGAGDGGGDIQTCVPIGNTLYVFKRNSIYAVTGYDFQAGEYQFQITLIIWNEGVPAPGCVAILDNALVFWNGTAFKRLQVGAFETEHIGATLLKTQGVVAQGDPTLMRAVAGDFPYLSLLNADYDPATGGAASEILPSVAMFAFDSGNGVADQVLVYDDTATQRLGNYAWSLWSGQGWQIGAWIPFGTGPAVGPGQDQYQLIWLNPNDQNQFTFLKGHQFGANANNDNGSPIVWGVQTGWYTTGDPALQRDLHQIWLELAATGGANITGTVITPGNAIQSYQFATTTAAMSNESFQSIIAQVNPRLYDNAFMFSFQESGLNTAFELVSLTVDAIEEPYAP